MLLSTEGAYVHSLLSYLIGSLERILEEQNQVVKYIRQSQIIKIPLNRIFLKFLFFFLFFFFLGNEIFLVLKLLTFKKGVTRTESKDAKKLSTSTSQVLLHSTLQLSSIDLLQIYTGSEGSSVPGKDWKETNKFLLLAVMAGGEYGAEYVNGTTSSSILAAEGVEFLVSAEGKVPLLSLDQKKICLFFSANWCRPCRAFIPQLVQVYNTLRNTDRNLEIIFVSFDRDENGFREHFKLMPWLAVPFDISIRRRLCDRYHVDRIPSLIPLGPSGEPVEEDAVELIEDYGIDAFPFSQERREELKALDKMKRQGGKLEELLVNGARDWVISGDGRKVLVAELVGKTIGLYFGAHWCPPCRAFTIQLKEAYNELKTSQHRSFEIIFISTDRDQEEFNLHITSMPWLAIPYNDKTQQDLCRIFDIKGIPALVLLGPDGKTLSTNGRALISSYGAKGFPFTESRRNEVEAALRNEVNGLPRQVKDPKHEHVLKLDMAKAYVCDFCKGQGRFWVFSCDKCNFDLHPTCLE